MIFAERKLLDEPIVKTVSRNMFYDENGKRVRTKKEILGEDGEIREGCRIVKKVRSMRRSCLQPKMNDLRATHFWMR